MYHCPLTSGREGRRECVCVCVCVREREREREKKGGWLNIE